MYILKTEKKREMVISCKNVLLKTKDIVKKIFSIILIVFIGLLSVNLEVFAFKPIKKNSYYCNQQILRKYNSPVVFNVKSRIYHEPNCQWALKCTENGYYMERSDAQRKGRPCKVCH